MPDETIVDERKQALEKWGGEQLGCPVEGVPASSDASFRRYFRLTGPDGSVIAMDAPPQQEDSRPFVDVARRLAAAGVHVPSILAADLERGFLLLSDLGRQTYLDVLDTDNADALFNDAIDTLVRMQASGAADGLPAYDEALLRRELALFGPWYVERHLGLELPPELRVEYESLCDLLVAQALAQQRVFVHRDFMPRNLMLSAPNPGVLDFQDAVLGPVSYDPVCLVRDAFISWPPERERAWLERYWQRAGAAGVPVPQQFDDFLADCDLMGAQRHLKVIGIFARICHRDGKPHYLADVPRFFGYLRAAIGRRDELAPLGRILDWLDAQGAA